MLLPKYIYKNFSGTHTVAKQFGTSRVIKVLLLHRRMIVCHNIGTLFHLYWCLFSFSTKQLEWLLIADFSLIEKFFIYTKTSLIKIINCLPSVKIKLKYIFNSERCSLFKYIFGLLWQTYKIKNMEINAFYPLYKVTWVKIIDNQNDTELPYSHKS